MNLLYQTVRNHAQMPEYAHDGDAGMDLRIMEDVTLKPNERKTVGTGLAFAIPDGCVGLVFPRSGLASKTGVTLSNCVGVIDATYRGEVGATLHNISDEEVRLEAGTRVCQMVIVRFEHCEPVRTVRLDDTERGAGGFGSTGTK